MKKMLYLFVMVLVSYTILSQKNDFPGNWKINKDKS
jgi:hypothetical protein